MTTHLGIMVLFAAMVSLVFGTLMRETLGDELRFAGKLFLGLVGGAWLAGWVMFFVFG